jgi:Ca2+-binding EF-hand superfamily protein
MRRQDFKKIIGILVLVIPQVLMAQQMSFNDFDVDGDHKIEKGEFIDVFTDNYLEDWDQDDDDKIDREDFYKTTYAMFAGDDEKIERQEWDRTYVYYYDDYLMDDFVFYDLDNDGMIEYAEYRDAMADADYFLVYDVDRDMKLSEDEVAEALFEEWDLNNNGILNEAEYLTADANVEMM